MQLLIRAELRGRSNRLVQENNPVLKRVRFSVLKLRRGDTLQRKPLELGTGLVILGGVCSGKGNFVTPAFVEYAGPLIGGPLPEYARLEYHRVPQRLTR